MSMVGVILFFVVAAAVPGCARALVARLCGVRVPALVIGVGPRLATLRFGATRVALHALPVGAFSQIAGLSAVDEPVARDAADAFGNRPLVARGAILFAGAIGYFACALAISVATYTIAGVPRQGGVVLVDGVVDGRPAARAGLAIDDELVAVDGVPVSDPADVPRLINGSRGAVELRIRRAGEPRTVVVQPQTVDEARRIGIQLRAGDRFDREPFPRAFVAGARYPFAYFGSAAKLLWPRGRAVEVVGPVGIVKVMRKSAIVPALIALRCAALLVLMSLWMLLPVPPLDGGRALCRLWHRRPAAPPPARDLGLVPFTPPRFAPLDVVAIVLLGLASLPFAFYLVPIWSFVALVRRRPLAWAFVSAMVPSLIWAGLWQLATVRGWLGPLGALLALLWLVVAVWLRSSGVRARFGLVCPGCAAPALRPVVGSDALSCLACGSCLRRRNMAERGTK